MDISSEIDTLVKKLVHCLGRTQPARCAAQHARGGAGQTGLEDDDLFVETDKISREINRARHAQTGPARTDASTSRSCRIVLRAVLSERKPPASVGRGAQLLVLVRLAGAVLAFQASGGHGTATKVALGMSYLGRDERLPNHQVCHRDKACVA